MTGITSSNTSTAIIVNRTAPLLINDEQALDRVVLVMAVQSATVLMLLSKVIAIKPTNTMTAMLIIVLTSTIGSFYEWRLLSKVFHFRHHFSLDYPVAKIHYGHAGKDAHKCCKWHITVRVSIL